MANIRKLEGKTGISYKITVTQGKDAHGKQVRHYKTWKPDRAMTERQMEKAVQRVALDFERGIEQGYQLDNRQTVEQYARYVIELKQRQGAAKNTIALYNRILAKIAPVIGNLKLLNVRPQHINNLYRQLERPDAWAVDTVKAKVDIEKWIVDRGLTRSAFAKACGFYKDIILRVCAGEGVRRESAEKIAQQLDVLYTDLFEPAYLGRKLSPNTIRRIHSFLSVIFGQAEKEMLISYNPVSRATPPPAEQQEPDYFQPAELARILEALEEEDIKHKTMVHLLIVTGCRRGEILGLKWEKVDFENRQLKIDACLSYLPGTGIYEGPTKTRNNRFIPIPAETAALLRKYRVWQMEQRLMLGEQWHDTGYVFTRANGEPENPYTIGGWLTRFSQRHGLPHIKAHAFRHTFASVLISEGVDVVTVSKMLGHAKTSMTTDIYSHVIEESKRKAAECIADVMLRKKQA